MVTGRQGTHSLLPLATQATVHSLFLEQVRNFWICHDCVLGFQSAGGVRLSVSLEAAGLRCALTSPTASSHTHCVPSTVECQRH